jgi:hypothetical protein
MTGILRNSHCYVKCTSYENSDNALCQIGKDFACSKDNLEALKKQYEVCKKEICSKRSVEGKARVTCKNEKCDRKNVMDKIKKAEDEHKRCKKDKSIPKNSPNNLISGKFDSKNTFIFSMVAGLFTLKPLSVSIVLRCFRELEHL